MKTSQRIVLVALWFVLALSAACTSTTPEPGVTPSSLTPEIFVFPGPTEKILISADNIPQPNCDGGTEMSATVERSHMVMRTLDLGASITVDANGQAGLPVVGQVNVGVAVATHYKVGYGSQDTVTRSVTVAAREGSSMLHTIHQYEIWETGELLVVVGDATERHPYRFRKDFSMDTMASANVGCPGQGVQSPPVDAGTGDNQAATPAAPTAAPQPGSSSGITAAQLDGLFGSGNWFCFPDRNNGVGVKMLPLNFAVVAPLRYVDTFRGRFLVGQTELGGTGGTAELTTSVPSDQCPGWQQSALSDWRADRGTASQITSATQFDALFGQGNWSCLEDYPFGATVHYLNADLSIEYPFSTADANEYKYGVGEVIPAGSALTVWFAGSIPSEQCPN